MLGIDYSSSDEEELGQTVEVKSTKLDSQTALPQKPSPTSDSIIAQNQIVNEPIDIPAQGPSRDPRLLPPLLEGDSAHDASPSSPYTSNRALVQNLTLPTVPNFDIPASPPGSPSAKVTKKFAQFLELKKKDQHFNRRLEGSSVLRDPSHLQKLMNFAGLSKKDFYASALPNDLAVPTTFPEWAYVEELKDSQKRMAEAKAQERSKMSRESIDFVSANKSGKVNEVGRNKLNEATSSGLKANANQDSLHGFSNHSSSKRKQLEHRGRDETALKSRWSDESRSPKRRRSRSRDGG